MALDIECGVGLGESDTLRAGERSFEFRSLIGHGAKDRIAGAVDDAVHSALTIPCERLAQRPYNRYPAADAGLESNCHSRFGGGAKEFLAVLRKQGFVAGDNVPTARKRL